LAFPLLAIIEDENIQEQERTASMEVEQPGNSSSEAGAVFSEI
jgi:hypothetical protein